MNPLTQARDALVDVRDGRFPDLRKRDDAKRHLAGRTLDALSVLDVDNATDEWRCLLHGFAYLYLRGTRPKISSHVCGVWDEMEYHDCERKLRRVLVVPYREEER